MSRKSDMASGIDLFTDFVASLVVALRECADNNEKIHEAINELIRKVSNPVSRLFHDMNEDGWNVLEHVPRRITSIADLLLVPFLREGEYEVGGEEMIRRARVELDANLGLEDAEWIFKHRSEIMEVQREFHILFPGTILEDLDGIRHISCFFFDLERGRWILDFIRLDHLWDSGARLLRQRNK